MRTEIKLSVLVTCYNQRRYIEEAIDSVYAQRCSFPYEVIVGDDGSNDGSYELICKKYGERKNFRVVHNANKELDIPPATSASRMRIELLKHVKGEYFIYLDGDDFHCNPLQFQKQLEILDSHQDVVICGSSVYYYDQSSGKKELHQVGMKEGYINVRQYWKSNFMHANSCVIRSQVIENIPYNYVSDIFHDNLITFCVMLQGKGYYLDSPSLCYRQENNGDHIIIGCNRMITQIRLTIIGDVCNMIGPQYKGELWHRYNMYFTELFKYRRELQKDASLIYWTELSERLGCKRTMEIVHYGEAGLAYKMWLDAKYFVYFLRKLCENVCARIIKSVS